MINKNPSKFFPIFFLLFLSIYLLQNIIPANFAKENSLLENLQLVILLFGAYICSYFLKRTTVISDKYIWSAGSLLFVIFFLREISWGRTLLMRADGTIPAWTDLGLYGHIAHPLVGLLLAILLYLLYRGNIFKFIKKVKIPLYDCILLFGFDHCCNYCRKRNTIFFSRRNGRRIKRNDSIFRNVLYNFADRKLSKN